MTREEFMNRAADAAYLGDESPLKGYVNDLFDELERLRAERDQALKATDLRFGEKSCAKLVDERDELKDRLFKAVAEVERLRVERDSAEDLYEKCMVAIHNAAGVSRNGLAGILGWIDEANDAIKARKGKRKS